MNSQRGRRGLVERGLAVETQQPVLPERAHALPANSRVGLSVEGIICIRILAMLDLFFSHTSQYSCRTNAAFLVVKVPPAEDPHALLPESRAWPGEVSTNDLFSMAACGLEAGDGMPGGSDVAEARAGMTLCESWLAGWARRKSTVSGMVGPYAKAPYPGFIHTTSAANTLLAILYKKRPARAPQTAQPK
jgi:hypothetical protein